MAEHTSFAYWLKHRYADWRYGPFGIRQLTHPERRISVFSRWLDVELDVLVCWMCGERPDPKSIGPKIAPVAADPNSGEVLQVGTGDMAAMAAQIPALFETLSGMNMSDLFSKVKQIGDKAKPPEEQSKGPVS